MVILVYWLVLVISGECLFYENLLYWNLVIYVKFVYLCNDLGCLCDGGCLCCCCCCGLW